MGLQSTFEVIFYRFEQAIIVYIAAINIIYFFLMVLGFFALRRHRSTLSAADRTALMRSNLVPAISVIAPAYNEETSIRQSIRALLSLEYPDLTVVVVNDGSTDSTLAALIDEFRLYKSSRSYSDELATEPIKGVYESRDPVRLVVVDKENGGKSDSLNAGIRCVRTPLFTVVDADSLLEPGALLSSAVPFMEDEGQTIAMGGIVRVVNGCPVSHGQVASVAAPGALLPLLQAVEYLRAFLGGRVALSYMNALVLISGAFGVFRRDAVVEVGGFRTTTVGEDMELVLRLHRVWSAKGQPYRIVFMPDPVCWTEVPETMRVLQRQRNRWQRGTVESLWAHRRVLFNPRYGMLGLFAVPYFAAFEMFGPAVELIGYVLAVTGLALGLVPVETAALFFVVSILFGALLSMGAIVLDSFTTRHYPAPMDVVKLFCASILENFGFRQIVAVWRAKGFVDALRRRTGWGKMERGGFNVAKP
jgi:cellulose synthase/poly-beta-1,6-N-acetylglucosamine synthase-like glycosyltransferase